MAEGMVVLRVPARSILFNGNLSAQGLPNVRSDLLSQWEEIALRSNGNEKITSETNRKESESQVYLTWPELQKLETAGRSFPDRMKKQLGIPIRRGTTS
jgi:hypothetical protein